MGLSNIDNLKIFFEEYRVTALNVIVKNGEFCKNNKLEFVNDHTFRRGDFKVVYYPNNPKIEYNNSFDESKDEYWIFKNCENINLAIIYEIYPFYPLITIPTMKKYTNFDGFKEEYNMLDKNNTTFIKNDILSGKINENITIEEFLKNFN
jgi:hypothetical protein